MAKQMWLTNASASIHRGNNNTKLNGVASWWKPVLLSESRGATTTGSQVVTCYNTPAGPTVGLEVCVGVENLLPLEWLSEPLSADFTIAGTITANLWGAEGSMNDNSAINFVVDKIDGATGTITQIVKSARTTELALSTHAVNNFTASPTSTACKRGDRLRVRVFADDAGTMGAGGITYFSFDKKTAAVDGDSWIQFTENLTFEPSGDPVWIYPNSTTVQGLAWGHGSGAGMAQAVSQAFVAVGTSVKEVQVMISKDGTPTDNVVCTIETDSGGSPSGTVVGTIQSVAGSTMPTTFGIWASFVGTVSGLSVGSTYHIVFRRTGAIDAVNYYTLWQSTTAVSGWASFRYLATGSWAIGPNPARILIANLETSTYYLTDTAETINPGVGVEKKALTTRGSGSTNAVTNTPVGQTAGVTIGAVTFGAFVEWYSPPLPAFTLGGKGKFNIRASESNAAANASLKADIAVCANDGTSPVLWGAANIEPGATAGEIGTVDAAYTAWVSGDDVAITDGQRLRFRILVDDLASGPVVTGNTVTVSYNGATPGAAGDTYVILPALVPVPGNHTVDSATASIGLVASGSDTYTPTTPTSDSATVGVLLVASGVELKQPTSSGTLYFRLVSMPFYRVVQVIAGNEVTLREFPYTDLADEQARRLEIGVYTRDRYAEGKHVRIYSSKDRGELVHQEDLLVDSELGDLYRNV